MIFPLPLSVAERFVMTLEGLYRAVAARSAISVLVGRGTEVLAGVLITAICQRVRRVERQIVRMLALYQAGRLRVGSGKPGDTGRRVVADRVGGVERR